MANDPVFVFVGAYSSEQEARADYEIIRELHTGGLVGTYDAAVITKSGGKVHVHKHEKPTQHGAWTGLAVGALVGILFPPSIIGAGAVGAATGGLVGHLWHGMSRSDVEEIGELLDEGQAAVIAVGTSKVQEQVERAMSRALTRMTKQLDAEAADLDRHLETAST